MYVHNFQVPISHLSYLIETWGFCENFKDIVLCHPDDDDNNKEEEEDKDDEEDSNNNDGNKSVNFSPRSLKFCMVIDLDNTYSMIMMSEKMMMPRMVMKRRKKLSRRRNNMLLELFQLGINWGAKLMISQQYLKGPW